jgi:4-amino-4-deoxy-L-arabinose transferase-like glycosyltransferase
MRSQITKAFNYFKVSWSFKLFILILLTGALLRYYGIQNSESTDEYNEVIEALRVASGKFNYERWWKKGYQNILALEYGFYFVIGYLLQLFKGPMDFAAKVVGNMDPLFLIGRYTTATMGTLSIGFVFAIGRRLYNSRVALVAAALFAFNTIHVWTSHLVNTDVPLTFFFLIALYFVVRFFESGKVLDYMLAAFFSAVAINIKLIGFGIGVIYIMSHMFRSHREARKLPQWLFCRETLYSFLAFSAGLIVSNPPIILAFRKWIGSFLWQYGVYINVYNETPYAIGGNAYYTYMILVLKDFGPVLFALTLAGLAFALYKRENWDYILLVFVGTVFVVLASTTFLVQDRYLMITFPALFLLGARLLDFIAEHFLATQRKRITFMIVVLVLALLFPLVNSIKYVVSLTDENTSVVSKRWIESNIPSGSTLLVDAGRTIITAGPRLNQSRKNLEEKLHIISGLKEGETYDSPLVKIVDSYSSIYFKLLLENMPEITYDITTTELGKNLHSPDDYAKNGFDYFIHNEDFKDKSQNPEWRTRYPRSADFYDSFDKHFELVKSFSQSCTRSGPTIKIYKVK